MRRQAPGNRRCRCAPRNGRGCALPQPPPDCGAGAGRHQIDHRCAGAQLHELGLVEPALDVTAQHLSVEFDCPVEIGDPQYKMVEPGDLDRTSPRSLSTLEDSLRPASSAPFDRGRSSYRDSAERAGRLLRRRLVRSRSGAARMLASPSAAFRPAQGHRRGLRPSARIAPPPAAPRAARHAGCIALG